MSSIITLVYLNGKIYEIDNDITFEGPKKAIQIKRGISFERFKKRIHDKVKLQKHVMKNETIS